MSETRDIQERIQDYLDGRLEAAERQAFERELERDAELRARVSELRAVGEALREEVELPPGFSARARERFEHRDLHAQAAARGFPFWQVAGVAASVLLVAVLFYPQLQDIVGGRGGEMMAPAAPVSAMAEDADEAGGESPDQEAAEGPVEASAAPPGEAELDALKSLGYIGSGDEVQERKVSAPPSALSEPLAESEAPSEKAARKEVIQGLALSETARKKRTLPDTAEQETKAEPAAEQRLRKDVALPPSTDSPAPKGDDATTRTRDAASRQQAVLAETDASAEGVASDKRSATGGATPGRRKFAPEFLDNLATTLSTRGPLPAGIAQAGEVRVIRSAAAWKALRWDGQPEFRFDDYVVVLLGPRDRPLDCERIEGALGNMDSDVVRLTLPAEPGDGVHGCYLPLPAIQLGESVRIEVVDP